MLIRDIMARRAFALGQRVDGIRRVRLSEVASFRGLIPRDHPSRIRPLADAPAFNPIRDFALSEGFLRRVSAICEPAETYPPYPFFCRGKQGGLVVAGGCVLTELASSAFIDTVVSRFDEDGGVQRTAFRVKGPVSDVDNFIVIPKRAGVSDHRRMCAARAMAHNAVTSVDAPSFAPDAPDARCELCHTDIDIEGEYLKCSRSHVFHTECIDALHRGSHSCACSGCLGSLYINKRGTRNRVNTNATRSTVNVCVPGQHGKPTPIWQLTSRVYAQPEQVITSFDLPLSQVLFDGEEVWMTELCALCLANGILLVTPFNMSGTCEFRTLKYLARYGVDLFVPGLTAAKYAAMPPLAMRGIQGIKWIVEAQLRLDLPLGNVWCRFASAVNKIGRGLAQACDLMGCAVPQSALAAYSRPYGADQLIPLESLLDTLPSEEDDGIELPPNLAELPHAEQIRRLLRHRGLSRRQRTRIATADGNAVDWATLDLVRILRFHIINPGEQSFSHAHIARRANNRGLPQVSPLACMQLWTECFRKLGVFMQS
jgi:hypothetical protein